MTNNYEKSIANRIIAVLVILCLILIVLVVYLAIFTFVVAKAGEQLKDINLNTITQHITEELSKINGNIQQGLGNITQELDKMNKNIERLINESQSIKSVLIEIRDDVTR